MLHVLCKIQLIEILGMELWRIQVIGYREFLISKSPLPEEFNMIVLLYILCEVVLLLSWRAVG